MQSGLKRDEVRNERAFVCFRGGCIFMLIIICSVSYTVYSTVYTRGGRVSPRFWESWQCSMTDEI